MTMGNLGAVVDKHDVDRVLADLREDDVYDESRRLAPYDDERVAIPVRRPVDHPAVETLKRGVGGGRRRSTLAEYLRERGWSTAAIEKAPSSYARVGDVVVVNEPVADRATEFGEALLDLHGAARTVLELRRIEGVRRRPSVRNLAGDRQTSTVHREHGVEYELDLAEVMFSPGNQRERVRMGEVVTRGERVLDLCAGIGYFTLPMATAGATVTAIERHPVAYRYLSRNLTRNGVDDRVVPVLGDCRATPCHADRAVIGHLPVHDCRDGPPQDGGGYLDAAVRALRTGGWLHVHGIAWSDSASQAATYLEARLRRRGVAVASASGRRVKSIAPRTDHVVIDAAILTPAVTDGKMA